MIFKCYNVFGDLMYYTYILRCDDNSLYTGITNDINKRIYSHYKKLRDCAKYTRSHQVVKIEKIFMTNEKNLSAYPSFCRRLSDTPGQPSTGDSR